ncbi:gamma-glutamyl hydrolase B [Drosophila tropicalis]|uniref:gamma-glutamyl hydrolase B n=1 Tax=Drosophila tropicalis TaxID=46794 RepID=UPI0035AC14A1
MSANSSSCLTPTPNIGILCIDIATTLQIHFGKRWYSYLVASYVKYLEASGAHVVPIWIGRNRSYYESIMSELNGILLPGGAVFIDEADSMGKPNLTNDSVQSAYHIFDLAIEINAAGKYFPIWGTCLGFQLLMIRSAKSKEIRTECENMLKTLPLELTDDWRNSSLLQRLPTAMCEEMRQRNFACHQHRYCIPKKNFKNFKLFNDWRILATRFDTSSNQEYITLIEHRRYPIFGCQFHPERIAFEQQFIADKVNSPRICIELAQFLGNTFVDACRHNGNRFGSSEEKFRHLIWNWQPVYSGDIKDSHWSQCYLFEKK